ncbi:MAG: hypothetical protein ABEK17_05140 [Candidatus Aenigmatarchaeota archaeon]
MFDNLKSKINEALSSQEQNVQKEKLEIDEEDLLNFVRGKSKEFEERLSNKMEKSMEKVEKRRENLKENIEKLKDAKVNPEAIPRLKKAVETNKRELVGRLENFHEKSGLSEVADFEEIKDLTDEFMEELRKTSNQTNRNFMFVSKLLKEESRALRSSLTNIEDVARDFQEFLEENEEKFVFEDRIKKYLNRIDELEEMVEEIDREEMKDRIENQEKEVKKTKERLEELKNGDLKKQLDEIKNNLKDLKENKKKIETQILKELSDLRKAFKKYKYQASLEGMEQTFLGMYINSPLKALEKDESNSYLKGFMKQVQKFISRDALNLDEKRISKIEEKIEEIKDNFLKDRMIRRKNLMEEIEEKEWELEELNFKEKMEEKQRNLKKARSKLNNLKEELKNKMEEKRKYKKEIGNIKNKMENLMEKVLDREVELN